GFRVQIDVAAVVVDACGLPVCFEFVSLGRADDSGGNFFRASIFSLVQREREQSAAVRPKAPALLIKRFEIMTIAVTTFGVGIDHVSPGFIIDRIAVVVLARVQQSCMLLCAMIA